MRKLTDHIVSGYQAVQLEIRVVDEPGQGGACHEYQIRSFCTPDETIPAHKWNHVEVFPDGSCTGELCAISFQNGPIKECGVNGITQEALLAIVIDRLRSFQAGPFSCTDNAEALAHCQQALHSLQRRTLGRIARGVEGTNQR
jgi:hypothetical protein